MNNDNAIKVGKNVSLCLYNYNTMQLVFEASYDRETIYKVNAGKAQKIFYWSVILHKHQHPYDIIYLITKTVLFTTAVFKRFTTKELLSIITLTTKILNQNDR